jgi:outer membrane protein assembly factor BamB
MKRAVRVFVSLFGVLVTVKAAPAQVTAIGLIPDTMVQPYGLTRAWFTHVRLDSANDRIANIAMHTRFVDAANKAYSHVAYEVRTPEGDVFVYSQRDLGAFGRPLGDDGAKAKAEAKQQELVAAKKKATLTKRSIPETTLFVQSTRGVLQAIDAETGKTLWSRRFGRPDYPSTAAAANDRYVAVLNGVTLYLFSRDDGKLAWQRKIVSAPSAGPAMSEEYVFVPTVGGSIEGYQVADPLAPAWVYTTPGRVFVQPVATPNSLAWPTERGQMYVSRSDVPTVRYRLETSAAIVTPPAYRFPMLYAASRDGYIYAVHETAGGQAWRFSVGMPVVEPPAAVGDSVYVSADRGGMYRINSDNGQQVWLVPNAARFLAASTDRVYALDRGKQLLIIDGRSGGVTSKLSTQRLDVAVVNHQTDRIYLGTKSGLIQCLHEIGHPMPLVHVTDDAAAAAAAKKPATPMGEQPADAEAPADAPAEEAPAEEAPAAEAPAADAPAEEAMPETAPEMP